MELKVCFVLLQLVSFWPMLSGQQCDKAEANVDYKGDDIRSFFVDTIEKCCLSCGQDVNCGIWTFVYTTKMCYLKYGKNTIRIVSSNRNIFLTYTLYPVYSTRE